ncbi:MAG: transglycosylase domain-containing protein [Polyangia bacterium]
MSPIASPSRRSDPLPSERTPRRLGDALPRGRLRWLLLAGAALVALGVSLPFVAAYVVRSVVLPRVAARLGVRLEVREVKVRPTRVRLLGFIVSDGAGRPVPELLRAPQIEVTYAPLALLGGQVELGQLTVERPVVQLVRGGDEDNVTAVLAKLRGDGTAATETTPKARRVHGPQRLVTLGGDIDVRDELGSFRASALDASLVKQGACTLALRDATVEPAGVPTLRAAELKVSWQSQGRFVPSGLPEVEVRGGQVAPWPRLAMTGIAGTVRPDEKDPIRAVISLTGGYGGVDKELWHARGWLRPDGSGKWSARTVGGELQVRADRFNLSQLEPVLKDTPIIDADQASVDAQMDLRFIEGVLTFGGRWSMAGLSVFSPRLVTEPVRNLAFDITASGQVDVKARKVKLERASFAWNGVQVVLDGEAEAQPPTARPKLAPPPPPAGAPPGTPPPSGPGWRERWRTVSLHLTVPPVGCQALLNAIPAPIVPRIREFQLAGTFFTDVRVFVDFAKLLKLPPPVPDPSIAGIAPAGLTEEELDAAPEPAADPRAAGAATSPAPAGKKRPGGRPGNGRGALAPVAAEGPPAKDEPVQVGGQVGIFGCRVVKAPPELDMKRFLTSFTHTVLVEPGRELSFVIGPENPDFVPYDEISPYLINSIMTTEDHAFLRHRGFIVPEFRSALQSNLERGYFRLGASSITMQMVKNVMLSREKTLSRKLQELFLTWYVETNLTTDEDLIKALTKGMTYSQYQQQLAKNQAKNKPAPLPLLRSEPTEVSAPGAAMLTSAGPAAGPSAGPVAAPAASPPPLSANQIAAAQSIQAIKEASPIKKRILEIYFNAIEFGPYIYGIGRATRHYFGKAPKDLTPREASFFSSILPNPKRRYIQYCKGAADDAWEKYVERIVRRVHSRGRMTDEELQKALQTRLVFDRTWAQPDKECLALIEHLTTLPPPGQPPPPPLPGQPQKPPPLPPWVEIKHGRLRYVPLDEEQPAPGQPPTKDGGPAPF